MIKWQEEVYGKKERDELSEYFKISSPRIKKRDNWVCQCCGKDLKNRRGILSVHHKLPRAKGGSDNSCNLITLCNPCHDLIEMDEYLNLPSDISCPVYEEDLSSKEWRKWVYGGHKRPSAR